MKRTRPLGSMVIAFLVSASLLGAGCQGTTKTGGNGEGPPPLATLPSGPIIADCGAPAVHDLALKLLDDVASGLMFTGDWRGAVGGVAVSAGADGPPAVKCDMQEILARSKRQLAASASMDADAVSRTQTAADRATTWLGEHS